MKKIFKFILYLLILLILAGLISFMVIRQNLSWLVGFSIYCYIIGFWLGIFFIKRLLTKKRMKDFVNRVVQQQSLPIIVEDSPANSIEAFRENWKNSINLLRSSKKGNKLPWFLVLGGADSGKTTAIKYAKLNTPFSLSQNIGISATKNCDWWFFDKSIILDTSSRYIDLINEDKDSAEWKELLHCFGKYNGRKPLNGIVVAISAKSLLSNDYTSLREEGQVLRRRIDNLIKVCWAKFPIYIMITKMDEIYGFSDTFLKFSESETQQAAGYINLDNHDFNKVVDNFMNLITNKIRDIRSDLINKVDSSPKAGLLIFPQEFAALRRGLEEFSKALFENNPYQENIGLRGIYFSSAQQNSESRSSLLKYDDDYLANLPSNEVRGLFLRDFFDKIIVNDKNLVSPVYAFHKLRLIIHSTGILSILCIFLAIFSLSTANYLHHRKILHDFLFEFSKPPKMSSDMEANLVNLDKFRKKIQQFEEAENKWLLPSLGVTPYASVLPKLKMQYENLSKEGYIDIFNEQYKNIVYQISTSTESGTIAGYVALDLEKIKLVEYYLNSRGPIPSTQDLANAYYPVMRSLNQQNPDTASNLAAENYTFYLKILNDNKWLKNELRYLLYIMNRFPNEIILQDSNQFKSITLSDFWGHIDSSGATNKPLSTIPGMLTKAGMKEIEYYLGLMRQENIITSDDELEYAKFWDWYRIQYFNYWEEFAKNFSVGAELVSSSSERKNLAAKMAGDKNPYYEFLRMASEELAPDEHLSNPPDWVKLLLELNTDRENAKADINQVSIKQNVFHKIENIIPKKDIAATSDSLDNQVLVIDLINEYDSAVSKSWLDLPSDNAYFNYVGDMFSEYDGTGEPKTPIIKAATLEKNLKLLLESDIADDDIVWPLEVGPLNYLIDYYMNKASCAIQSKWSSDVLDMISGVSPDKTYQVLFNNNGLLLKFMSTNVTPFLNVISDGYSPKTIYTDTDLENKIDFDDDFILFLSSTQPGLNSTQSSYLVKISSVPTVVNHQATIIPYGTVLTVECSDGDQVLQNYNNPSSTTINWSPDKCADTTLKIMFPNFTLTKTYPGTLGFSHFLADFKTGTHEFSSEDFIEADLLKNNYKIKWIEIKYNIKNSAQVINLFKAQDRGVPNNITYCDGSNN